MPNPEDYKKIAEAKALLDQAVALLAPIGDTEESSEMETEEAGGEAGGEKNSRMAAMQEKYSKMMG